MVRVITVYASSNYFFTVSQFLTAYHWYYFELAKRFKTIMKELLPNAYADLTNNFSYVQFISAHC